MNPGSNNFHEHHECEAAWMYFIISIGNVAPNLYISWPFWNSRQNKLKTKSSLDASQHLTIVCHSFQSKFTRKCYLMYLTRGFYLCCYLKLFPNKVWLVNLKGKRIKSEASFEPGQLLLGDSNKRNRRMKSFFTVIVPESTEMLTL